MYKVAIFLVLVIGVHQTNYLLQPLGSCLGNCRHCDKKNLELCRGLAGSICSMGYSQKNSTGKCLPDQTHRDEIKEFNDYQVDPEIEGWNFDTHETCQYPGQDGSLHKFNILGFFSTNSQVAKNFPIRSYHRSVILSFNIIRNGWQPFNDYLMVILKTNNKILSSNEISFDRYEITDSDLFKCHGVPFKLEKYQIETVLGEHSDTELTLSFQSNMKEQSLWGLTNLHLLIGCANFIVPDAQGECKQCQPGFYKIIEGTDIKKCERCPGVCIECTSETVCTKCVEGMQAYNNQCYYLKNYNKTSISLPSDEKCANITFIKSGEGVVELSSIDVYPHTHIAFSFSIFYDPSEWDDSSELHIFINDIEIYKFTRKELKTYSTGQCDYFPSHVFQHEKLTTPYHENNLETIILKFKAIKNGGTLDFGLNAAGLHYMQYLCTENCIKCNRNVHECLKCKEGFRVQNKTKCVPIQKDPPKPQNKTSQTTKDTTQNPQINETKPVSEHKNQTSQAVSPPLPPLTDKTPETQKSIQVELYPEDLKKNSQNGIILRLTYPPEDQINDFQIAVDQFPNEWLPITSLGKYGQTEELTVGIEKSFVGGLLGLYLNKTVNNNSEAQSIGNGRNLQESIRLQLLKKWPINRYDYVPPQQYNELGDMGLIFAILAWVALIGIILTVPFAKGIIFEELVLALQLIFLHVFIYSEYLPLSLKIPLKSLHRIQVLNYLPEQTAKSLESAFVGDLIQVSPLRFSQFRLDINFTRAFYPTIIINVFFIAWFVLMLFLTRIFKKIDHPNKWQKKAKQITEGIVRRKLNYFDQIWRYQFLTTFWVCLLQFYNLSYPEDATSGSPIINGMLCFSTLAITLIWPIFVIIYTYKEKDHLQRIEFREYFEDIFYLKVTEKDALTKYESLYLGLRPLKYIFYAISASWLGKYPLGAMIPIIILQITEMIYILASNIFKDKVYLATRIVENSLFTVVAIMMIILYSVSTFVEKSAYFEVGYAIYAIMVLILVNGLIRSSYLAYCKFTNYYSRRDTPSEKDIYFETPIQSQPIYSQR